MDRIVQPTNVSNATKNTVEIVVHVTEELSEDQRDSLAIGLKHTNGIMNAEFCPLRYHLILVRYDTDAFSSQDVLKRINSQAGSAEFATFNTDR